MNTTSIEYDALEAATEAPQFIRGLDIAYGITCLACFIFGTIGNGMALIYFLTKSKDVPTLIYNTIVIVDVIISVLVLPIGVSFFDNRNAVFFANSLFCDIWAFMWTTLSRMSVFLVALLSVTRAYSLMFPFKTIKKRTVGIIIGSVGILHALGTSIPFWFNDGHYYTPYVGCCITFGGNKMPKFATDATKVFDWIGMFIPIPIIITSFVLTLLQLVKKSSAGGGQGDDCKKNVTTTIALFTTIFLSLNIPAVTHILIYNFLQDLVKFDNRLYLATITFVLVIPINSALNPVIYFWRMDRMREHSIKMIKKSLRRSNRGRGPTSPETSMVNMTMNTYTRPTHVSYLVAVDTVENSCL